MNIQVPTNIIPTVNNRIDFSQITDAKVYAPKMETSQKHVNVISGGYYKMPSPEELKTIRKRFAEDMKNTMRSFDQARERARNKQEDDEEFQKVLKLTNLQLAGGRGINIDTFA